jgi:hypothetical protein
MGPGFGSCMRRADLNFKFGGYMLDFVTCYFSPPLQLPPHPPCPPPQPHSELVLWCSGAGRVQVHCRRWVAAACAAMPCFEGSPRLTHTRGAPEGRVGCKRGPHWNLSAEIFSSFLTTPPTHAPNPPQNPSPDSTFGHVPLLVHASGALHGAREQQNTKVLRSVHAGGSGKLSPGSESAHGGLSKIRPRIQSCMIVGFMMHSIFCFPVPTPTSSTCPLPQHNLSHCPRFHNPGSTACTDATIAVAEACSLGVGGEYRKGFARALFEELHDRFAGLKGVGEWCAECGVALLTPTALDPEFRPEQRQGDRSVSSRRP